jgi:multicomponent K+:H+ antiporter subunit A
MLLLMLLLPFMGALALLAVNNNQRRLAVAIAGAITIAACALLVILATNVFDGAAIGNGARFRLDWLPSLGVAFSLRLDGLAFLFSVLILGIGALVVLYGAYYLSSDDPPARFFAFLLFFMGAMLGVVLSDNLILLVVFWELTSLSSFLLIGYWRHREDARQGARMALAVTGAGGLALLAGVLLIGRVVGSYDLDAVFAAKGALRESALFTPIILLVLLGAFTKSAQFPFHFWLPRAMAAPTPVSAYLHSATMVKAGVFLLARLYPALGDNDVWFWVVSSVGLATLLFGAVVAIFQHDLKGLLAYSTISHLGLITLLFGLDTPLAVVAGVFHIINHAVFKASLFMAAGIIEHESGSRDMRQLNGLWKAMPITATLAMVACAAMAGVPLANGFLSKEMFFAEALAVDSHHLLAIATPIAATIAAVTGVAYSLRFIHDVFFNGESIGLIKTPHEPPRWMRVPVEILVVLCLLVGIFPAYTIGPLLAVAATSTLQLSSASALPNYSLAIWHGVNLPLLMSGVAMVGGVALYVLLQKKINLHTIAKLPGNAKTLFDQAMTGLIVAAEYVTRITQNGSLSRYLLLIVLTAIVGAVAGIWTTPSFIGQRMNPQSAHLFTLLIGGIGMSCAIATVVMHRERVTALILLGMTGLVVTLTFVYFSAPDLALTQALVEVVSLILMMLALNFLPRTIIAPEPFRMRQWRDVMVAVSAGGGMTWLVYQILTTPFNSISPYFLRTTVPEGGGANAVNVIIVDFRGLDTLGEIAVLGMAGLIVAVVLRGVKLSNSPIDGQFEAISPENTRPSLILSIIAPLLLPLAVMVSIYFYIRGHNVPGGGFIAGLVFAIALVLQYVALGRRMVEASMPINYAKWIGCGLLFAGLTGIGSMVIGFPFLTSTYQAFTLPIIGAVPIASAMFFDLGVFVCVIGGTMLALSTLAKLNDIEAKP